MHNYSFIDFRNEIRLKPFCIIIHLNCINIHLFDFHYGNHLLIIGFYYGIHLWDYGISFYHQYICVRVYMGIKITAPFNGVVSFICSSYIIAGNSVVRQTVDARLINGLWIMVYGFSFLFLYMWWNKTRKKVCWLQIYAGIIIWGLSQCCQIKPVLRN